MLDLELGGIKQLINEGHHLFSDPGSLIPWVMSHHWDHHDAGFVDLPGNIWVKSLAQQRRGETP